MADNIKTFTVDCSGGMITNLSPLQQSSQFPGSARSLINFEPNLEGGYQRIKGAGKLLDYLGNPMLFTATRYFYVVGATAIGATSVVLANLPDPTLFSFSGTTFKVGETTHTITATSLNSTLREITLTFTPALTSALDDGDGVNILDADPVGFSVVGNLLVSNEYPVTRRMTYGVYITASGAYTGYGFAEISNLGSGFRVNGAGQTGGSLMVDGLVRSPMRGDCFKINNVSNIYTVTDVVSYDKTTQSAVIDLNKPLASTPSDNATITLTGVEDFPMIYQEDLQLIKVDTGVNSYIYYDGRVIVYSSSDGRSGRYEASDLGCGTPVVFHKNQLFTRAATSLIFSAPYDPLDFSPANGAGEIQTGSIITDVKSYKDQLFIFCEDRILTLIGNTSADFVLKPFSLDVGCPYRNTVQQLGGDIIFLSNDGFRLLSVTDKYGDFNAGSISNVIKAEVNFLTSATAYAYGSSPNFVSVSIPEKNQYRIFRKERDVNGNIIETYGLSATLASDGVTVNWSIIDGMAVGNCSTYMDSSYNLNRTAIFYASSLGSIDPASYGYVYAMEYGTTFDGEPIVASYKTPFFTFDDPRVRKSLNKLTVYCDKESDADDIEFTVSPVFDLDEAGVIQPSAISMGNINADFGDTIGDVFESQLVGGGFTVSFEISCTTDVPSFSVDNLVIEYMLHERR